MVKKTSFLEKLKTRWKPASGVRFEPAADGRGVAAASESRIAPVPFEERRELVSGRKLSGQQEAVLAINEGFKELASLLRGMQTRVDDQGERLASAADSIGQLPALGQSQIDLLRVVAERLERQNVTSNALAARLEEMPTMLADVRSALDRAAATDERAAATLDEFKSNMGRIQDSMRAMVEQSGEQARAASSLAEGQRRQAGEHTESVRSVVEGFGEAQRTSLDELRRATTQSVDQLGRSQREQGERLERLVAKGRRSSLAIVALLAVAVASLVAIALLLASR